MPQVSRVRIEPELKEKLVSKFIGGISSLGGRKDIELFLMTFLTDTEVEMLAKRLEVQKRLLENEDVPYREIGYDLSISSITVARHKRILKKGVKRYKELLRDM